MKYMSISALIMISSVSVHAEEKQMTSNSREERYFLKEGKQYEVCRKVETLINSEPRAGANCGVYWLNSNAESVGFKSVVWKEVDYANYMEILIDEVLSKHAKSKDEVYFKKRKILEKNIIPKWNVKLYSGDVDLNNDGKVNKVFRFLPWGCVEGNGAKNIILGDDLNVEVDMAKSVRGELFLYEGRTFSFFYIPGYPVVVEPRGHDMVVKDNRYVCELRVIRTEEDAS